MTATSDFNQWLHAMKLVACLQGGVPSDFRKKLWLALADRYIQSMGIDWTKEHKRFLNDHSKEDDEQLGIQIVKDLHRTGLSHLSGPAGTLYQAKLKRVLLAFARWNPEVGYCQGFNMLGALILQVMDKSEAESLKVMIFLIEGILPQGYFNGSMGGLQADMAVFRELLCIRLPKLAKHLRKLQGNIGEGSFEPPLTNVFTMQWFLTLFCTCLPISSVLRVWDLVMIEGSGVILRTAIAIWSIVEDQIILVKTADDFYCKMGELSATLLSGQLIDSNGLIQKIVDLGQIRDLNKLRAKHLYFLMRDKKNIKIYKSGDENTKTSSADDTKSKNKKVTMNKSNTPTTKDKGQQDVNNKDVIALDISILKKQYEKLKERQKQANIILTTARTKNIHDSAGGNSSGAPISQLLAGKNAVVNKSFRSAPRPGIIPPARKISVDAKQQQKRNILATKLKSDDLSANKKSELSLSLNNVNENQTNNLADTSTFSSYSSSSSYSDSSPPSSPSSCNSENIDKRYASTLVLNATNDSLADCAISKSDSNLSTKCNDTNETKSRKGSSDSAEAINSISQLSPIADFSDYMCNSSISPLEIPSPSFAYSDLLTNLMCSSASDGLNSVFHVDEDGVTNEYFERVNTGEHSYKDLLKEFNKKPDSPSGNSARSMNIRMPGSPQSKSPSPGSPTMKEALGLENDILKIVKEKLLDRDGDDVLNSVGDSKQVSEDSNAMCMELTRLISDLPKYDHLMDDSDPPKTKIKIVKTDFDSPYSTGATMKVPSGRDSMKSSFDSSMNDLTISVTSPTGSDGSCLDDKNNSDSVLSIIEENSKILKKIMDKKTFSKSLDDTERMTEFKEIGADRTRKSLIEEDLKSKESDSRSSSPHRSKLFDYNKNDNISSTLNSIQKTIHSIDTLCKNDSTMRRYDRMLNDILASTKSSSKNDDRRYRNESNRSISSDYTYKIPNSRYDNIAKNPSSTDFDDILSSYKKSKSNLLSSHTTTDRYTRDNKDKNRFDSDYLPSRYSTQLTTNFYDRLLQNKTDSPSGSTTSLNTKYYDGYSESHKSIETSPTRSKSACEVQKPIHTSYTGIDPFDRYKKLADVKVYSCNDIPQSANFRK